MKKILTIAAIAGAAMCPAIAFASEPERGEASVAYVGPYDNPTVGGESVGSIVPFDSRYDHSYCQTLYTPDVLTDLNKIIDGKPSKSEISALTFKMNNEWGAMPVGQKTFTVYIQNIDATAFPTINNEKQWFEIDKTIQGFGQTEEYEFYADELLEYTITFDTPFVYEGKSILITWISDGSLEDPDYSNGGMFYSQVFYPSDGQTHSGIVCSDSTIGTPTGALKNSAKELPVLKIDYTPLFENNGLQPVTFENVEVKLEAADVVGSYYSKANAITVSFDVNDPTNGDEYEIFLGTQSLGTLAGTSGTIRYFAEPKADIVLLIEPKSDDAIGTSYTIAKADLDALFPTPGCTFTGSYALYSEYDIYNDMEGTLQGAAQFRMTSSAPVARMWADAQNPVNSEQMYRGGTEYPDNLMALVPRTANASTYSDLEKNGGIFAMYAPNLGVGKLRDDVMQWPETVSITINAYCMYPLVSKPMPVMVAGKGALEAGDDVIGSVDLIRRDVENGTGYSKNMVTATMAVDAAHFKQDVTYVDRLRVQRDLYHGTLQFFAPRGMQIQYMFEAEARAEGEWVDAPTNPWTFNTKESEAGTLTVRTVNPNTGVQKDMMTFIIDANGGFMSSLQTVNAAANANVEVYNLQGKRLAAPAKGINIVNGKKVIF